MKKTLLTMAAALAMVGCQNEDLLNVGNNPALDGNAIAFGTYVGDNAQTRASVIDNEVLGVKGFGVNAWYTGTGDFTDAASHEAFMTNTKVTYDADKDKWTYSPLKYWPNNADDQVSFFAYGPYAKDGNANNIEVVTDDEGNFTTDLKFTVPSDVKEQVDLIYNTNHDGTVNQGKPEVGSTIDFKFDHALSRISFTVEAAVDEVDNGSNLLDGNTRINVKKVALVGEDGYDENNVTGPFYTDGTLSLLPDYVDAPWTETAGEQGFVFDATNFYHTVKDKNSGEEVVQLTRFNASEPQRLLNDDSYLMVIPQEASFKIYIEYDVISEGNDNDGNGDYDGSIITNCITSEEAITVDFVKGMAYNFNLVLGMTSVKFAASVTEWTDPWDEEHTEWLPNNSGENGGNNANTFNLRYKAYDMFPGDVVEVTPAAEYSTRNGVELTLVSVDESIAKITEDGKIMAVAQGQTTVYVSCDGYDDATVEINVMPRISSVTLSSKINTVLIESGNYIMGNNYGENPEYMSDAPEHLVTIAENFYMGQYEVTVEQFVEFIKANAEVLKIANSEENNQAAVVYSYMESETEYNVTLCELATNNISGNDISSLTVAEGCEDLPVRCSWNGAAMFAESVGGYLPHEEEWEYAARGGTNSRVWWMDESGVVKDGEFSFPDSGDNISFGEEEFESDQAKKTAYEAAIGLLLSYENMPYYYREDNETYTYPVGYPENAERGFTEENVKDEITFELRSIENSKKSNPWGLYNVLGNVVEWCGNYDYDYELGIPDEVNHIVRGHIPGITFNLDNVTSYTYTEGVDEPTKYEYLWMNLSMGENQGVAMRNVNTTMNETGFRIAFKADYSGQNQSVQNNVSDGE